VTPQRPPSRKAAGGESRPQPLPTATVRLEGEHAFEQALPFTNMSADPDNEYFSDGLSETIINSLTQIENLRVVARTSAFSFKGKYVTVQDIGNKLGVDHILEGSVQKSKNRLRITAQLISVTDGYHLWSQQFDKNLDEIFVIQDEIASSIVDRLKLDLLPAEKERLLKRYTSNTTAYSDYLRGRFFWNKRSKDGFERSIHYYHSALEKDPDFVLPYTGLADVYGALGWYDIQPKKEVFEKSKKFAQKALELDDDEGEAHAAMGNYLGWCEFDWKNAEKSYRSAIRLNPSNAEIHHQYAHLFQVRGLFKEAISEMEIALDLEPLSVNMYNCLGQILFYSSQYERAREILLKSIELDPDFFWPYFWIARVYQMIGRRDKAVELYKKAATFPEIQTIALGALGYTYGIEGKPDSALQIMQQFERMSANQIVDPLYMAWIYIGLNDQENALEYLDEAIEGLSLYAPMLKIDPIYDRLRLEEKFGLLLEKMDL
jgi:TolB-like protein/Tfp pilus assembly protein PilF